MTNALKSLTASSGHGQADFHYEAEPTVSVTVTATDRDGLSSSETVSISITDVNERPFLALRAQTLALREGQSSSAVTGIQVIAADPDKDDLTFTLSDDRFEIRDRQIAVKEGKDFDFETEPSIRLSRRPIRTGCPTARA